MTILKTALSTVEGDYIQIKQQKLGFAIKRLEVLFTRERQKLDCLLFDYLRPNVVRYVAFSPSECIKVPWGGMIVTLQRALKVDMQIHDSL